jgi:adenylate cyclase
MTRPGFLLSALCLLTLAIYLFASAPPLLPEASAEVAATIPIEKVLGTVAAENDVARALYTQQIVTDGKAAGLMYQENWRDAGVDAGPLPALFLREAAGSLQKSMIPLGLFLGSDYPISPSNQFGGAQAEAFARIRQSLKPEFFYATDTGQYTAMFPDFAGVQGCVTCHNEHAESPKTDWAVGDVMGATTWTYDKSTVSEAEYLRIVASVRESIRDAYGEYLKKVDTFANPPEIGDRWPAEGYYLPSAEVFMAELAQRASAATVEQILNSSAVHAPSVPESSGD